MGIKLKLHISFTKTITPEENETIYSINWDNDQYDFLDDGSEYPVRIKIGKTVVFETNNSAILDYIKWLDDIWMPFVEQHTNTPIPKEKYDEWDKMCSEFEKAVTAETGYDFRSAENEYDDEPTIEYVGTENDILWEW